MSLRSFKHVRNKKIVLDTCIFRYLGDKGYRPKLPDLIRTLSNNGNELGASRVTVYELRKRSDVTDEEWRVYRRLLHPGPVTVLPVDNVTIDNASILYRAMHPKNSEKDICADMIIGSEAVDLRPNPDTLLFTADRNDFSHPYWKVFAENFIYKDRPIDEGGGRTYLNVYLLEFDVCKLPEWSMNEELRARCVDGQEVLPLE